MSRSGLVRASRILFLAVLLAACSQAPQQPQQPSPREPGEGDPLKPGSNMVVHRDLDEHGFWLASSFEQPVCGYYGRPDPGCEFGVEGNVETGPVHARTGKRAARIDRAVERGHMGVLALVQLPVDAPAYWGVAHRIPEIPSSAFDPRKPYLEISQISPTDGRTPGWPVEVRIYEDRTLGLALWRSDDVARTTYRVPVDAWFYVVVEVRNGDEAAQRMWVYDEDDELVDEVELVGDTRVEWVHERRMGQKVGGNVSTPEHLYFYADDWYIAPKDRGPLHLDASGAPVRARG